MLLGKFDIAFVAIPDEMKKSIDIVAHYNTTFYDTAFFSNLIYNTNGPIVNVLKTKKPVAVNNLKADWVVPTMKAYASVKGYKSAILLPIKKSDKIEYIFYLYSKQLNFFNNEEISLLEDAVNDISLAFDVIYGEKLRKEAEDIVKLNHNRLQKAQEIAHYGSCEIDFSTKESVWSDELCHIYGEPIENKKQNFETWFQFIHPDDRKYVMDLLKESESNLSNLNFYHRIIRKDGIVKTLYTRHQFEFNHEGLPKNIYSIVHDITDYMANITQLKAQNKQLQDIAWMQSHKLRSPLASILGLVQLFPIAGSIEESAEIIELIKVSAEKLDNIVREIVGNTDRSNIKEGHIK